MRHFIANVVSVIYSAVRFSVKKIFCWKQFDYYIVERFSPNVHVQVDRKSRILLGKRVRAHSGSRFTAVAGGEIILDDDCKFNRNCAIVSRKRVHIASGVEFGPGVIIYDHDHDFRAENGIKSKKYKCGDIEIGENSWIGANTIILRDTVIGKNCVIGAGSVVRGTVPDNSILVQKRENTITYIKPIERHEENV